MMEQLPFTTLPFLLLLLLLFLHSSQTLAQGPAAAPIAAPAPPAPAPPAPIAAPVPPAPIAAPTPPAPAAAPLPLAPVGVPAPPGPTDVTIILQKAGKFTVFTRLLRETQVASQLYGLLNNSNNAFTILAPTDNAFSALKSGTLNQLNDEEKTELIQFHVSPTYLTPNLFQTVSNPLRTQAGDSGPGKFQLNVTTSGSSVNITSGITNTSVSGTVYTDGQLAIYQIDRVLLPLAIFGPKPPKPLAPAPSPDMPNKKSSQSDTPRSENSAAALSLAMQNVIFLGVISTLAAFSW